ncbi:MAG: hypothetical protein Kow0069_15000 [Promethearchaeota archaeon]
MEKTAIEKLVREIAEEVFREKFQTVQLELLRREFLTREEFLAALERIDERFEEARKERLALQEQMDKRFEEARKERLALQEQMDKRFEEARKERLALQEQMDKRFEATRRDVLSVRAAVDNLGDRSGKALQNAVLELAKELVAAAGVDYEQVETVHLVDRDGAVFFPGYGTDVDVLARDGKTHLFEVRYKADQRDFFHILKSAELYEHLTGTKPDRLFVVTLEVASKTLRSTSALPVGVIAGSVVP